MQVCLVRCANTRQMCGPSAILPCLSEPQSQDSLRLSRVAGRVDWTVEETQVLEADIDDMIDALITADTAEKLKNSTQN